MGAWIKCNHCKGTFERYGSGMRKYCDDFCRADYWREKKKKQRREKKQNEKI